MRSFLFSLIFVISAFLISFGLSCYFSYSYPLEYRQLITDNAEKYGVDAHLVASIINVESGFDENATSSKGAIGLMQILPSTADWISGKTGIKFDDLYSPKANIEIGSYYLSYLIKYFSDVDLAICAYNAGQGNVNRWLSMSEYSHDGKTLSEIPFKETRNYLKKVKKNLKIYKNKFN